MKSRIPAIQLAFLIAFGVICAGLVAYQALYIWPENACEHNGDWWDPSSRTCAKPIPISQFTGRKVGGKLVIERVSRRPVALAPGSR
jgi:hypothetical protein